MTEADRAGEGLSGVQSKGSSRPLRQRRSSILRLNVGQSESCRRRKRLRRRCGGSLLSYDVAGNRKTATKSGVTETYNYDADNQVTTVVRGASTLASTTRDISGRVTGDQIAKITAWPLCNIARIRKEYVDDAAIIVEIGRRISRQL